MLGILSEISQYDNKIRSERSRIGRFNKVQQGGWKGGPPPFGYRLVDRRLEIDPFESEWVRAIYNMSCQGKSSKTIQIYLNSHGVLTRRGNRQWSIGSIDVILTNPIYIGYYDYTDKLLGETARIKTPPIVDPWMFEHIKLRRKSHRGVSRSNPTKHFYLLRGLISCGHCERLMGGRINRTNHRLSYYCVTSERLWLTKDDASTKWKRGVDCPMSRSINIGKTDQTIIELLHALLRKLGLNHSENNDLLAISYELKDAVNRISEVDLTHNYTNDIDQQTFIFLQQSILTTLEKITVSFDRPTNKHQIEVVLGRELGAIVVANGIDHLDLSVGSWVVRTMSARYVDEVASGRAEITERHKDRIRHGRIIKSIDQQDDFPSYACDGLRAASYQ